MTSSCCRGRGTEWIDTDDRAELSGVGYLIEDRLAVVSNEAIGKPRRSFIQIFKRDGDNFIHEYDRPVFTQSDESKTCRADIEGLSVWDGEVFVTPSFSLGRKKPGDKAAFDNGDVHGKCVIQTSVLRLGHVGAEKSITPERAELDIAKAVAPLGVLEPFLAVPAKENGMDIEGLAVTRDKIYLGLRGPVLDPALAAVIVADRGDATMTPELRYIDLGGLGIRDMTAVGENFLLIAGPVGRIDAPFLLYSWSGEDAFPGRSDDGAPTPLCTLGSGAEGIAARPLADGAYELTVVFDGKVMKAQVGRLPRPAF
jgi:hypothetical protein